jgi:hypothetical protein
MIESILEHKPWDSEVTSGTLSTTSGSDAVSGAGTAFLTEAPAGTILVLTYQVASVADNTNLTLEEDALSAATGVSFRAIAAANQTTGFFRADNAVPKKPVVEITVANSRLANSIGQSQISVDEGVLIKSIYVRLPYQYPMADTPMALTFFYLSNSGANLGGITAFGGNTVLIPNENIEIPIDAYVPPPTNSDTTWQIAAQIQNAVPDAGSGVSSDHWGTTQISQVDGPDMLNGLYLPIYVGIRMLHGIALT